MKKLSPIRRRERGYDNGRWVSLQRQILEQLIQSSKHLHGGSANDMPQLVLTDELQTSGTRLARSRICCVRCILGLTKT